MKNLIKVGVAGALALGATVAAHASITVPTSSGTTGDVVLFADVFNGSTLVKAYAGDTGIAVDSIGGGTLPSGTFLDSNLSGLLASATAGTTVVWALEGGGGHAGPSPYLVSSSNSATQQTKPFGNQSGQTLTSWGNGLVTEINNLNGEIGSSSTNSVLLNSDAQTGGTGFNPNALAADVTNWYGNTTSIATSGLGASSVFYLVTATSQAAGVNAATSALFKATLSGSGLSFSNLSAVPLPAAVWLLGSGLLGLMGVARRKIAGV